MEFVCNDVNGPSQWFYDPEAAMYIRKTMTGEVMRQLPVANIADPEDIRARGREPQVSTVALWEHRRHANNDQ